MTYISKTLILFLLLSAPIVLAGAQSNSTTTANYSQPSIISTVVSIIEALIRSIFSSLVTSTTTVTSLPTTTVQPTTILSTTTTANTTISTTITNTSSTTSTTSVNTTSTTSFSTTTIPLNASIECQNDQSVRPYTNMTCPPITLYIVNFTPGNTRYEIANITVNIYLNGTLEFANQSLEQNLTTPYLYNLSNGNPLQIYAYQVHYSPYPLYQSANISIVYR